MRTGALGGYDQLLTKYADDIKAAQEEGATATPRTSEVRRLLEKSTAFRARVYASTTGIRDRHKDSPSPEQVDEIMKWFTCLGDFRDSAQEAAKARALAKELREKAAERERCEADPACRAKQATEDKRSEAQQLADDICDQIAERRETKGQIASEHRYSRSTGVVNLKDLQTASSACAPVVQVRLQRTLEDIMEKDGKWIMRWKYAITPKPVKPGVWRRKEGGFLIRGRAVDRRTGKLREIMRTVDGGDASGAYRFLQEEVERVRSGEVRGQGARIRFSEYAASLFERKVTKGKIRSAKTREKWESVLRLHLLPAFGDHFLDGIRRADIEGWLEAVGRSVRSGKYSPVTVNNWLDILRVIITSAVAEHELPRDPIAGIEDIDTSTHFTYSEEQPNSLLVEEVPLFLGGIRRLYPQHFGMVALGFATGLRPSSLRPLRRQGPEADVRWDEGVVLVRRSHTRHDEVMEATKQKTRYRITLPDDLMAILRWHVDRLPPGPMRDSELLFPAETGGFRSASALDKPFREVGEAINLRKRITPRAMRRRSRSQRRHRDHRPAENLRSCHAGDVRPLQHGPSAGDSGGCRGGHFAREVPRASTGRCIVVGKWWEGRKKRNGHPGSRRKWPMFCGRCRD